MLASRFDIEINVRTDTSNQTVSGASKKLEYGAVIRIQPRFDDGIDHGSAASPKFCGIAIGLKFKFLNRVDIRALHDAAVVVGIIVNSIQNETVQSPASAIRYKTVLSAGTAAARVAVGP